MQITDTIADLLTRIRNAVSAKHDSVDIPASNMKKAIVQILVDEGYVKNYTVVEDGKQARPRSSRVCAGYPSRAFAFIPALRSCRRS